MVTRDELVVPAAELPLTGNLIAPGSDNSAFHQQIRGVFEGFALIVALIAVERLFLGRGGYTVLTLHPFWLPVLLVSLQHGLFAGVATAFLAAAMSDWPIRSPGQDIASFYLELVRLPVQWLLVALAIGVFRQAQLRAGAVSAQEIARLRAVNERFATEITRLDDQLWRFEMRTAIEGGATPDPSGAPVRQALARLAALRVARPEEIGARLAIASEALLGPASVRLIRSGADGLFDVSPGRASEALDLGLLEPRLLSGEVEQHNETVVLPLEASDDRRAMGFLVAEIELRGPAGLIRREGLHLLADAAATALTSGTEYAR